MRLVACVLTLLVAVAGCSAAPHGGAPAPARHPTPARHPVAPVSARVVLPSPTMKAGSQVYAQVIVENNTGRAINTGTCGTPFQVALVSSHYHPVIAWAACAGDFTIPSGVSRYRVPVFASYSQCAQGRAQPGMKRCLAHGPPPLPPGYYQARLFQAGNFVPAPPAVRVHLIAAVAGS